MLKPVAEGALTEAVRTKLGESALVTCQVASFFPVQAGQRVPCELSVEGKVRKIEAIVKDDATTLFVSADQLDSL